MKTQGTTATVALLLALASGQSQAAAGRPLDLGLAAASLPQQLPQQPVFAPSHSALRQPGIGAAFARPLAGRNGNNAPVRADATGMRLREGALQGLLDPQTPPSFDEEPGAGRLQLKFHKRGDAFRDFNKSYREMCNKVSAHIWNEPNGKRVRFDVAGKPGFGVEIPIR